MFTCTAKKNQKLFECLKENLPYLSFSAFQKSLRTKRVRLNGRILQRDSNIKAGDTLELDVDNALLQRFLAPELEIVYEDDNILAVNKPQGIAVEDEPGKPSLAHWIRAKYKANGTPKNMPAPCHRLDGGTGGLVLFAKNGPALHEMQEAFRQNRVHTHYYCLVRGFPLPRVGEIRVPLIKDSRGGSLRAAQNPNARNTLQALTRYRIATTNGRFSVMEVNPVTARPHQIRVHMAYIGHPIIGDDKYGDRAMNKRLGIKRQQIYNCYMAFEFHRKSVLHYLSNVEIQLPMPAFNLRKLAR